MIPTLNELSHVSSPLPIFSVQGKGIRLTILQEQAKRYATA